DLAGAFDYQPLVVTLEELQAKALANRPDLRAAHLGITAADSQYQLAKANGKQDVTVTRNYSHVNGGNAFTFWLNFPLAIFDRNQGEIARTRVAITQAREQQASARGQVLTDVQDAYDGLRESERILQYYRSGYLETSQRSREISEYAYRRGA